MTSLPREDETWFCTQRGTEQARARLDVRTGQVVGYVFQCQHGRWGSLDDARRAHPTVLESP